MEALHKIKRRLKANLTRLETAVGKLDKTKTTEIERKVHLDKLEKLNGEFQDLAIKLSDICDDTEYAEHEIDLSNADERIYSLKVDLLSMQGPVEAPSSEQFTNSRQTEMKLPKLDMPIFSGSTQDWLSFRDLFIAIVHKNITLSGAEKLQYLKLALRGEPAQLIQSFAITDLNYQEAWNLLNERYQNTREIVNAHIDRMLSQVTLHQESATGLRKLADTTTECRRSLELLEVPVKEWDAIIVNIISKKLDPDSRRHWELSLTTDAIPTFEQLSSFIDQRARALTTIEATRTKSSKPNHQPTHRAQVVVHHGSTSTSLTCEYCKKDHTIYKCQEFLKVTVADRHAIVKKLQLCFNCLRSQHTARDCKSGGCRKCNRKHHTLLHYEVEHKPAQQSTQIEEQNKFTGHITDSNDVKIFATNEEHFSQVLLPTALIQIKSEDGQTMICRALLDSASQASFITESCVQYLNLRKIKTNIPVSGLNSAGLATVKSQTYITFTSIYNKDSAYTVKALIVPKITCKLPSAPISQEWPHARLLKLADPRFREPNNIDVLLGADIFAQLLRKGQQPGPDGTPLALESELGWILVGRVQGSQTTIQVHHVQCNINESLQKFWELEEASTPITTLTEEEGRCENHFLETHTRDETGRYVVQLPLRNETQLGLSRETAIARFKNMEKKLKGCPMQQLSYNNFLKEYLLLNHMEMISETEVQQKRPHYYMPHHSVIKEDSSTTKLRVVFDASCRTNNGLSLNDCLLVGPRLQDDLVSILLRFRIHPVAVCADIEKMYRQVRMHPHHTDMQRIVWREAEDQPIKDYRLVTVTYGTASAPYLAVRALQQLAKDEEKVFPLASKSTLQDFYVDDYMSGAMDEDTAIELVQQMNELMMKGGFSLRKWNSNSTKVLEKIPEEQKSLDESFRVTTDFAVKTLGIFWHPSSDHFSYSTISRQDVNTLTKRQLLSEIAKIFDPLGWISPVTIKAKILMQNLWLLNLKWDEKVPEILNNTWKDYCQDLANIEHVNISRCITTRKTLHRQIVAFCDASEKAYAAVVYMKTIKLDGTSRTSLVAAKTRVAPLKKVSIPRLELCAALLLSTLVKTIKTALKISIHEIHAYSDSTIVLTWLSAHPARWKTFVANRVTQIHDNLPDAQWHHVSGKENPADCASRGTTAQDLIANSTWWHGPPWLQSTIDQGNVPSTEEEERLIKQEERKSTVTMSIQIDLSLLHKYSTLKRLLRITAWCLRFKLRKSEAQLGFLKAEELTNALSIWIRNVQALEFPEEIKCMKKNQPLSRKSSLMSLNPYIDKKGLIRVGGRLQNAKLDEQRKHPILLPRKSKLTTLIVEEAHVTNLHAGPQLLLSILHQNYWILCSRDVVRHIVKRCVTCYRHQAKTAQQMMGNLPASRVNMSKAFFHTGVDYAGPLLLRPILKRSQITIKSYISVFVCMATRAIHLELVSDLSSEAFIAALKRFISRRGKPLEMYSDCGKNFVGANKEMNSYIQLMKSNKHNEVVGNYLSEQGIHWNFNPPSAAHFGGLWEAGVKSVKYHLNRVVGIAKLTFEEMYTVLAQVEACLNSRPLTPMSNDPADLTALTPGHFLIGDSMLSLPEPDLTSTKLNKLNRWQFVQQIVQHFWRRWSGEYLSRLQQRPKWWTPQQNIKVNDLVLLRDEQLPPTKWKLGRIIAVHPGEDGLVRVVTVRTSAGVYKRPIGKISQLPIDVS